MKPLLLIAIFSATLSAFAQEASSGVDLRATVTAQAVASPDLTEDPRSGAPVAAGYRTVLYPTIKLNDHLSITAALQSVSRPYFYGDLENSGYGIKDTVFQTSLNYARASESGSLLLRAGVLSTAFGSFPLRYDDTANWLTQPPLEYGYYYSPVTTSGLLAAQVDATRGKWDGRLQLANSSPANPQSAFSADQHLNWTTGFGYTVHQGFRIGVSAYRGPYLAPHSGFSIPGELPPSQLPARAAGVDVAWSQGHWGLQGEWQTFVFPYTVIPTLREQAAYIEARRVLSPRWYVATRTGYTHSGLAGYEESVEAVAGLQVNHLQTLKFSYSTYHEATDGGSFDHMVIFQLVSSLHLFSHARE